MAVADLDHTRVDRDTRRIMQTYVRKRRFPWPIRDVRLARRFYYPKDKTISYTLSVGRFELDISV